MKIMLVYTLGLALSGCSNSEADLIQDCVDVNMRAYHEQRAKAREELEGKAKRPGSYWDKWQPGDRDFLDDFYNPNEPFAKVEADVYNRCLRAVRR